MELYHFTKLEEFYLRSRAQKKEPDMKPKGFWVSDESEFGWSDWCEREGFRLGIHHMHKVTLAENANILHIKNVKEITDFNEAYSKPLYPDAKYAIAIDWLQVSKIYQGIIITPYLHEVRLEPKFMWYYGWDCASGCIWNKKAIKELKYESDKKFVQREYA